MAIDATKPALWRKKERKQFERAMPQGGCEISARLEQVLKKLTAE